MKVKLLENVLLFVSVLIWGCKSEQTFTINKQSDNKNMPNFISLSAVQEIVHTSMGDSYYWIEFVGIDTLLPKNYCFKIYNGSGKLLGKYYFFLMDLKKFSNSKMFFKDYFAKDSIEQIKVNDFTFVTNRKGERYFEANNRKYLMLEYIPRDMNPDNKKRKKYYEWVIPSNLPKHAVMIENTETDFMYTWRIFHSQEKLDNGNTEIRMIDYDYYGKCLDTISFNIKGPISINMDNYSFERSLFTDEWTFLNNGVKYKMEKIDKKKCI